MSRRPPPGGPGRPVHVLRVPEEDTHRVIFLGPYAGQIEHWASNRTFACPGGELCRTNHGKYRMDWYAYAAVAYFDQRTNRYDPWVIQITSNLEFRLRDRTLRGEVWDLMRAPHRGRMAELLGELVDQKKDSELPQAFDVKPPLERLFGKGRLFLGTPNPTPAPLILEEFAIETPPPAEKVARPIGPTLKEQINRLGSNGTGKGGVKYT